VAVRSSMLRTYCSMESSCRREGGRERQQITVCSLKRSHGSPWEGGNHRAGKGPAALGDAVHLTLQNGLRPRIRSSQRNFHFAVDSILYMCFYVVMEPVAVGMEYCMSAYEYTFCL
jgi:hypothetical protein